MGAMVTSLQRAAPAPLAGAARCVFVQPSSACRPCYSPVRARVCRWVGAAPFPEYYADQPDLLLHGTLTYMGKEQALAKLRARISPAVRMPLYEAEYLSYQLR